MDIKKGDRLEYNDVVCEVLWVNRPQGKAPTEVLLGEVIEYVDDDDELTGEFEYGERYRVTKAEALAGGMAVEADADDEAPTDPPMWYESAEPSDDAIESLEGMTADEAIELGEAGLIKLKGIGKATAAKVLEAAGA